MALKTKIEWAESQLEGDELERFMNNVKDSVGRIPCFKTWREACKSSFIFEETQEGRVYWEEIANRKEK